MKWVAILIIGAVLVGVEPAFAQFIIGPTQNPVPVETPPIPGFPPPRQKPAFQGFIPQLLRLKKPWELINPCAPLEYGNGSANTTWDNYYEPPVPRGVFKDHYDPSTPKGIIFFGITW